jgi:hypothetical protein
MFFYLISIITIAFGIIIIQDPSAPITLFGQKGSNVESIKWIVGGISIILGILLFYSELKKNM